jgi:secondary thiamine-phosphate synthase enzyme
MNTIEIRTRAREEFVDLTAEVSRLAEASGIVRGLCVVTVPHTTAGITVNENADPDVRADLGTALRRIVPDALPYAHAEGNAPAHVRAALVGSSVGGGRSLCSRSVRRWGSGPCCGCAACPRRPGWPRAAADQMNGRH